jgi:hypothetical protein
MTSYGQGGNYQNCKQKSWFVYASYLRWTSCKNNKFFATWIQWFEPIQLKELEQDEDLKNQTWPINKRLQEDGIIKLWTRNKHLNVLK